MSDNNERYQSARFTLGAGHLPGIRLEFRGVGYKGEPILDTSVTAPEGGILCAITWKDKDAFCAELQAVIDKYMI